MFRLYSLFFVVAFLLLSLPKASATSVSVAILTEYKITSLNFSPDFGEYLIYGDGKKIAEMKGKVFFSCLVKGDSVMLKKQGELVGTYKVLRFIGKEAPNSINIKATNPEKPTRIFDHNIELKVINKVFRVINRVNIDYYVAGVVEAENGIKQNFEYYKMKSIICRTYALSNLRRHEAEGFHLCDQVHCQVYKSKNRLNDDIIMASVATTGMVIVDSDLKLITAAFHSNCGGQTLNSEDVWSLPTTYLKSVKDTFCLRQSHSVWEHRISAKDWMAYLKRKATFEDDPNHEECYMSYFQFDREPDFISHNVRIPLKIIRNDFKLKSTFFTMEKTDESIVFKGKGFGHGIGLCQEGAMKMSQLGFKYNEILHFYYRDVHLVDLSVLDFFRTEN
jgi:stage II sporulation protein D